MTQSDLNKIPKNWQKVRLGEISNIRSGDFVPKEERQDDGYIPMYGSGGLVGYTNRSNISGPTIVVGRVGAFGTVSLVESGLATDNTLMVTNKPDTDINFLYYKMGTVPFGSIATGSSQQLITQTAVAAHEITIPPLDDQKKIASILSAFDDKIEVNNKIAKTLEEMAQALFKEWFVKLRFPGYERTEFVDSEFGKIPRGWLSSIGEYVEVTDYVANGSFASLRQNVTYYSDKNYAVLVRTKDLQENFTNDLVYIDQKAYEFLKKSKLFGGELILSNVGNVGAVFRCPKLNMPMSLGPNAVVVKNSVYTRYLFLYFKGKVGQSKLKSITGGSSQPKFNKTDLRSLKSIFPSKEVTEKFNLLLVDPIYKKIDQMELENQKLAALRDLLLPKLMKGKVIV